MAHLPCIAPAQRPVTHIRLGVVAWEPGSLIQICRLDYGDLCIFGHLSNLRDFRNLGGLGILGGLGNLRDLRDFVDLGGFGNLGDLRDFGKP